MSDIVGKLQRLKEVDPRASQWPPNFDWWPLIRDVAAEAIDEIERLRSIAGKAEVGQSFADVTKHIRYPAPRDGDPSMND